MNIFRHKKILLFSRHYGRTAANMMKAIQPYFVMATSQYNKGVCMKNGIAHFYNYCLDGDEEATIFAVPDASIDVIFEKGEDGFKAFVAGPVLERTEIRSEKNKEYFGIRFMPGVMPPILEASMPELVKQKLNAEDILTDKTLLRELETVSGMEEWIPIFFKYYNEMVSNKGLANQENAESIVGIIKSEIEKQVGNIKVEEIAKSVGYTARYVNQIFHNIMGISPKTFCQITKFQSALQNVNQSVNNHNLTEVGLDTGYYDQSHFIKEFKKYMLLTPKKYKQMIQKNHYNQRMKEVNLKELVCKDF